MPPTIQILAEKLMEAGGADYFIVQSALKAYLEKLSDVQFGIEVDMITNPNIIRYLWAAGLPLRRQSVASLKYKELTK